VAGTVLFALGLKKTLAHVTDPLAAVPAAALAGGAALYYLGLIAFRARAAGSLSRPRLGLALVLAALAPVATHIAAIVSLTIITAAMWSVIAYEAVRFRTIRDEVRHSVGSHIDGSHH
jgi:low temperature requirement protein LtrA